MELSEIGLILKRILCATITINQSIKNKLIIRLFFIHFPVSNWHIPLLIYLWGIKEYFFDRLLGIKEDKFYCSFQLYQVAGWLTNKLQTDNHISRNIQALLSKRREFTSHWINQSIDTTIITWRCGSHNLRVWRESICSCHKKMHWMYRWLMNSHFQLLGLLKHNHRNS